MTAQPSPATIELGSVSDLNGLFHLWTDAEYTRMEEVGLFEGSAGTELINGLITQTWHEEPAGSSTHDPLADYAYQLVAGEFKLVDTRHIRPIQSLYRWTHAQYEALFEHNLLTDENDVELVFGLILNRQAIKHTHAHVIRTVNRFFTRRYPNDEYELAYELPVKLPGNSQPKPDYVVAVFRDDLYKHGHPTAAEVLVVVEISKSSLIKDRTLKKELYARSGIEEYWLINIPDKQVELHVNPLPDAANYALLSIYRKGEIFTSPLVGEVAVDALIPDGLDL